VGFPTAKGDMFPEARGGICLRARGRVQKGGGELNGGKGGLPFPFKRSSQQRTEVLFSGGKHSKEGGGEGLKRQMNTSPSAKRGGVGTLKSQRDCFAGRGQEIESKRKTREKRPALTIFFRLTRIWKGAPRTEKIQRKRGGGGGGHKKENGTFISPKENCYNTNEPQAEAS